ncbi:hypothetical protein BAE44_0013863 [Dichanthelium oligosanthes]|uniref:RRM domain-containing protein n=1 Tax=Dichanthelium oligosanthes TaxID=888268 RepID=A0A1E5VJ15_9POAL|nr:hypothetical protein BAE44_0013863 [Dichanthelium oligosanthes]
MGMRDKKRNQKRVLARRTAAPRSGEGKDFLPLEGGPGMRMCKAQQPEEPENTATFSVHWAHPHGFYEDQMQGKSKHYGFIEFESPAVAKVVADEMNNYLLFEHILRVALVRLEKVHPKLWKGVRRGFIPIDRVAIERKRHSKDKITEEHKKMVEGIVKRDEMRRKRIKAAGVDYECPALVRKPLLAVNYLIYLMTSLD